MLTLACVSHSAIAATCDRLDPPAVAPGPLREVTVADLVQIRDLGPLAVSPDGKSVAFQVQMADPETNSYCLGIYVLDLAATGARAPRRLDLGGEFRQHLYADFGLSGFPNGSRDLGTPIWSPDGQSIAYQRRKDGVDQLWVAPAGGGELARQVSASTTDIEEFGWSPDGATLFYYTRPGLVAARLAIENEAARGFLYDERFPPRQVKPWPLQQPAELFALDIATRETRKASEDEITRFSQRNSLKTQRFRVQPKDFGWSGEVWGTDINGESIKCPAEECAGSVRDGWLIENGQEFAFLRREGWGDSLAAIYSWRPGSADVVKRFVTSDRVGSCRPSDDRLICLRETSTQPAHIVSIDLRHGGVQTLFDPNPEFARIRLQSPQRLEWSNDIGLKTYGDLVLPPDHKPGKKHPLIVTTYRTTGFLRGGVGDEYPIQLFANAGFAVLSFNRPTEPAALSKFDTLNPWFKANYADWIDRRSVNSALEAGIAAAIGKGVIDPTRIAVTGLSNGSSTVEWALSNSDDYAAASISSLGGPVCYMALTGPGRTRTFRDEQGLKGLTDPGSAAFWKRAAIVLNTDRVNVPLLVQVSDYDLSCAQDTFTALREQKRPVEMHVFPGEFHVKWQPVHRVALYRRNVQWFKYWMMGLEDRDPVDPAQYQRWATLKAEAGLK